MVVDNEEEEVDEEIKCMTLSSVVIESGISLHVVIGVRARGFQTTKVSLSVGYAVAVALLDSDSSHNFINI